MTPSAIDQLLNFFRTSPADQAASQPEQFKDGDASNPYDAAAMRIGSAQAQSRFTRTPIVIRNSETLAEKLAKAIAGAGIGVGIMKAPKSSKNEVDGTYTPDQISVEMHGQPQWSDMQNALHHEDIHALMAHAGISAPKPQDQSWTDLFDPTAGRPVETAEQGFYRGNRSGSVAAELPAYMGAYKPGQLTDVTGADREHYLKLLLPSLPPAVRSTFLRILASHDASQQFSK